MESWFRSMWLSNGDFERLFDAALTAQLPPGELVVVNGMSRNSRSRWDLSNSIGYEPKDDVTAFQTDPA